jgi:hypothetical protein
VSLKKRAAAELIGFRRLWKALSSPPPFQTGVLGCWVSSCHSVSLSLTDKRDRPHLGLPFEPCSLSRPRSGPPFPRTRAAGLWVRDDSLAGAQEDSPCRDFHHARSLVRHRQVPARNTRTHPAKSAAVSSSRLTGAVSTARLIRGTAPRSGSCKVLCLDRSPLPVEVKKSEVLNRLSKMF